MSPANFDTFFDGALPRAALGHLTSVLAFTMDRSGRVTGANDALRRFAGSECVDGGRLLTRPGFEDLFGYCNGNPCYQGSLTLRRENGAHEPYRGRVFRSAGLIGIVAEPDADEWICMADGVLRINRALAEQHRELGRSRRDLLEAVAELRQAHQAERAQIAHALHEEVCQTIAGLKIYLELLGEPPGSRTARCVEIARDLLLQVRGLSASLGDPADGSSR